MNHKREFSVAILTLLWTFLVNCDNTLKESPGSQVNTVNTDGTFHFGYDNKDQGAHYHKATGSVIKVRGRYGSRNPASGRIDETVYTAGPRGYRARGANIHRKQNLSQNRRGPVGSPSDPLADPLDDPSYAFGFKSKTHTRREESDSSGKVHGEFIYVDDVGDKHGVKYKAAAHAGFQVENGVPDSPSTINYNAPLYKTDPTARGKITFERGPDRQYKFLTSSPDQRRAETTGPDGITRGSYSYLDDKGLQRTVQYIAGAGIGYKIVSSTVGPGSHVSANGDVPEYSIKAVSNEIAVSDEAGIQYHHTGPSGPPTGPGYISSTAPPYVTSSPYPPSAFSSSPGYYPSTPRPFSRPNPEQIYVSTPSTIGGIDRNHAVIPTIATSYPSGGPSPLSPSAPSGEDHDLIYGLLPPKEEPHHFTPQYIPPTPTNPTEIHITPASHLHPAHHHLPQPQPSISPTPLYYPATTYLPTDSPSPYSYLPTQQPTLPTLPTNYQTSAHAETGAGGWFYGLAAGASKRAHIQNIDLVPVHERAPSPSEALRLDEEREAYQSHPISHQPLQHHHHHHAQHLRHLHPPPRV